MKAGKYNIKELFSNKNIESVVVPEIQRDYVWSKDQVEGLLLSITDDFTKFHNSNSINISIENDKPIEKALIDYYKTIKYSSSIGFIYAYSDFEYPDKYFLIDGQQRLTTIYLLLVVIASEDVKFKEQFTKKYFKNSKSFIEYRVREASLLFLNQSITHILDKDNFDLKEQYWYYNFYQNDKTILSIINNLKIIKDFLKEHVSSISDFVNYLLNHVQFWYFDTNISEQGEELYVYMNARGERMQSNENLKAELLSQISSESEKNEWGKKWEEWQNFFWLIRGNHENADNVFNEFIYCIAGLENQKNKLEILKKTSNKGYEYPTHQELLQCFQNQGLNTIEKYINSLKNILSNDLVDFCSTSNLYHDWIVYTKKEIKRFFNKNSTNWFIKINDPDRNTEQNRMVLVWSSLELLSNCKEINKNIIISLRIIYNRYHNYIRAVLTNLSEIEKFKNEGYNTIIENNNNEEEIFKYNYLKNIEKESDFNERISTIWILEDHPINLDGSYLKNINSIHLIDYNVEPTLKNLKLIKDKFLELFPLKEDKSVNWLNYKLIINCLITYGIFWNAKVTNGYDNLDFNSEGRIVRDIDSETDKCFKRFFNDFLKFKNLDELSKQIIIEPAYDARTEILLDVIQWYNYQLKEKMWNNGCFFIAMGNYNYQKNDKFFPNFWQLVNTKGNFNGGNPEVLSNKIKTKKS